MLPGLGVMPSSVSSSVPSRFAAAVPRDGVAVSTVRSQIGSIRHKTGAESIRALVRQVAVLPPVKGALGRNGARREPRFFLPRALAAVM